jgi:hypothetical protein
MNLSNERMIDMVEYDMSLTDEERKLMIAYGLERIQKDDNALINYALVNMLSDIVKELEDPKKKENFLKKIKDIDKSEKSDKIIDNKPKKRGRKPKA